jgi:hypothetical protein
VGNVFAMGTMGAFGPKQAWLAIRGGDVPADAVMGALGVRDLGEVDWRLGLDLAYVNDDRVVVTPPLAGAGGRAWVLVVGRWLLGPAAVDVAGLSAKLGTEVQFFATHRVIEFHRWERAVDGETVRAFTYIGTSGEVTRWEGTPDATERAMRLPETRTGPDDDLDIVVDESDVLRLAGAWSVDPSTLGDRPASGPLRAAAG